MKNERLKSAISVTFFSTKGGSLTRHFFRVLIHKNVGKPTFLSVFIDHQGGTLSSSEKNPTFFCDLIQKKMSDVGLNCPPLYHRKYNFSVGMVCSNELKFSKLIKIRNFYGYFSKSSILVKIPLRFFIKARSWVIESCDICQAVSEIFWPKPKPTVPVIAAIDDIVDCRWYCRPSKLITWVIKNTKIRSPYWKVYGRPVL